MSEQHTPGPWCVVRNMRGFMGGIEQFGSSARVVKWGGIAKPKSAEGHANARRIVACVNAFDGIPTAAAERVSVQELVEALRYVARQSAAHAEDDDDDRKRYLRRINLVVSALLAKLEADQ